MEKFKWVKMASEELLFNSEPLFQGGNSRIKYWVAQNTVYPQQAMEEGIEGRVLVAFVVLPSGKVDNPYVVRHAHPILEKEALRVVSEMPDWFPRYHNGKPKGRIFRIPIKFAFE
ncbi:MAG: energy transducer TonB [Fluviicola sp.]|nr:energy transducer TonB [Fluviicola sp.]